MIKNYDNIYNEDAPADMFTRHVYGNIIVSRAEINSEIVFNITWHNRPMKQQVYNNIKKWSNRNLTSSHRIKPCIHNYAEAIYAGAHFEDQMTSICYNLVKDNALKNRYRITKSIDYISNEYNYGACVLDLSIKYNYPAPNLINEIFRHMQITKFCSPRHESQFNAAHSHDAEIIRNAVLNEDQFVAFFRKCGISLRDQQSIVDEQIIKYGCAVVTPDILFIDTVYINNCKVAWIEYKDYVGANDNFLYKPNLAQSKKYADAFGPGAFCYGKSFVDNLRLNNTILLDGTQIFDDLDVTK